MYWTAGEVVNGRCNKLIDGRCAGGAQLGARRVATPTPPTSQRETDREKLETPR